MTAALGALLTPAAAGAVTGHASASHKKKAKAPVVTAVSPLNAAVGETLTLRGRYFARGANKNSVVFKRDGGKAVFVKAGIGTAKLIKVAIPAKLADSLTVRNSAPVETRFRLRVLSKRFGKRFTRTSLSPVIGPVRPPAPQSKAAADDGDCNGDGVLNKNTTDDDADGLPDDLELRIGTDPCKFDSDGDKVSDGFEYRSAVDLNDDDYQSPDSSLPYPGKRPYPNPLDGTDATTDFDGDGLDMNVEYKLWQLTLKNGASSDLGQLSYSDGLKYSVYTRDANGRRIPALNAANYDKSNDFDSWLGQSGYTTVRLPGDTGPRSIYDVNRDGVISPSERYYLDRDGNGYLSDDERDEDADGLSNWDEVNGRMTSAYWGARYNRETPFRFTYAGTDPVDVDSDGDGVRDGADDQDHDDFPNINELSRQKVTGRPFDSLTLDKALANPNPGYGRVNPFNPCLPDRDSRTCPTYIPFGSSWAPFDGPPYSAEGNDPNYLVLN